MLSVPVTLGPLQLAPQEGSDLNNYESGTFYCAPRFLIKTLRTFGWSRAGKEGLRKKKKLMLTHEHPSHTQVSPAPFAAS